MIEKILMLIFFIAIAFWPMMGVLAQTSTPLTASSIDNFTSIPTVNSNDLSSVGFTGIQLQEPIKTKFLPPVVYFRVDQTVAKTNPEWGDAANVISVSIVKMANGSWQYNHGQMTVEEMLGRTQTRVSSPGYLIVITGPDHNKVIALANILKSK